MARKTLKQKLKSQLRKAKQAADVDHVQAGLTINFETQAMQSIAMAHGIIATLSHVHQVLGDSPEYTQIEEVGNARAAQCFMALTQMGFSPVEANARIKQGH